MRYRDRGKNKYRRERYSVREGGGGEREIGKEGEGERDIVKEREGERERESERGGREMQKHLNTKCSHFSLLLGLFQKEFLLGLI